MMTAVGSASTWVPPDGRGDYSLRHLDIVLKVPLLVLFWFVGVAALQVGHQAGLPVL